jgi:hypothetical protein
MFVIDRQDMNQLNDWIIVQLMTIRPSSWLINGLTDWQKKLLSDGQTELVTKGKKGNSLYQPTTALNKTQ